MFWCVKEFRLEELQKEFGHRIVDAGFDGTLYHKICHGEEHSGRILFFFKPAGVEIPPDSCIRFSLPAISIGSFYGNCGAAIIFYLRVPERYRRKGVAKLLMDIATQALENIRVGIVFASTSREINTSVSHQILKRYGFTECANAYNPRSSYSINFFSKVLRQV